MQVARRIKDLPPYLFAEIDKKVAQARAKGVDVISLGIGDPDMPTPGHIVNALISAAQDPRNHRYPSYEGLREFREEVANWYLRRFSVELDPDKEVVSLIGSKEGIAHIPLCFVDPGDIVLVPDPGYPVYRIGTMLAGGVPFTVPLKEERGYLPDLNAIPKDVAEKAKLLFLNYPNNPTAATAPEEFFEEAVAFAKRHDIIVCHDAAYSEITFDGYIAPSFLSIPGAKDVGVEFHSLSKTFNMTGWRIGWACGNSMVIEALGRAKTNIDSGIFQAVQYAGIAGLRGPWTVVREICQVYQRRRDLVVERLNALGWNLTPTKASFYIWAPTPKGFTSIEFAAHLLDEAGVVVTPGVGYGSLGEGYFRISLTIEDARLAEALKRLEEAGVRFE